MASDDTYRRPRALFVVGYLSSCLSASFCMISTATDDWFRCDSPLHWGLWRICTSKCVSIGDDNGDVPSYINNTRIYMIFASCVLGVVTTIVAILIPCWVCCCGKTHNPRCAGLVFGGLILVAALLILLGSIFFIKEFDHRNLFGYSLILGWFAAVFAVLGGILIMSTSWCRFEWTDAYSPLQREGRTRVQDRDIESHESP